MSYAGKRALVCMKHVGLNVAADAFINSALTGVNGVCLLLLPNDPSMHSSRMNRTQGSMENLPRFLFEPSNQQQAYDMTCKAFIMSEKYKIPVLLRITTRLAHSRSGIQRGSIKSEYPCFAWRSKAIHSSSCNCKDQI